jgi:hypothetical protein
MPSCVGHGWNRLICQQSLWPRLAHETPESAFLRIRLGINFAMVGRRGSSFILSRWMTDDSFIDCDYVRRSGRAIVLLTGVERSP